MLAKQSKWLASDNIHFKVTIISHCKLIFLKSNQNIF